MPRQSTFERTVRIEEAHESGHLGFRRRFPLAVYTFGRSVSFENGVQWRVPHNFLPRAAIPFGGSLSFILNDLKAYMAFDKVQACK